MDQPVLFERDNGFYRIIGKEDCRDGTTARPERAPPVPCILLSGRTWRVHHGYNPGRDNQEDRQGHAARVRFHKIDRNAPAGSENSLGAESVRAGRPSTDDSTVEAIDEMGPGITAPLSTDKAVDGR